MRLTQLEKARSAGRQRGAHHRGLCARAGRRRPQGRGGGGARRIFSRASPTIRWRWRRSTTSAPAAGMSTTVANPVEGAAEALAGIGAAIGQEGGTEVAFLYLRLALYLDPDIAGGLAALSLGNLLEASGQARGGDRSLRVDSRGRAVPRARPDARGARARPHGPHRGGGDGLQGGDRRQSGRHPELHLLRQHAARARALRRGRRRSIRRRSTASRRRPRPTGASSTIAASATSAPRNGRRRRRISRRRSSSAPTSRWC